MIVIAEKKYIIYNNILYMRIYIYQYLLIHLLLKIILRSQRTIYFTFIRQMAALLQRMSNGQYRRARLPLKFDKFSRNSPGTGRISLG